MVRNFVTHSRKFSPNFFTPPKSARLTSVLAPYLFHAGNLVAQAIVLTKFASYASNHDRNDDLHDDIDDAAKSASLHI